MAALAASRCCCTWQGECVLTNGLGGQVQITGRALSYRRHGTIVLNCTCDTALVVLFWTCTTALLCCPFDKALLYFIVHATRHYCIILYLQHGTIVLYRTLYYTVPVSQHYCIILYLRHCIIVLYLPHGTIVLYCTCHMALLYYILPATRHYCIILYLRHSTNVLYCTCDTALMFCIVPATWHYCIVSQTRHYCIILYPRHSPNVLQCKEFFKRAQCYQGEIVGIYEGRRGRRGCIKYELWSNLIRSIVCK